MTGVGQASAAFTSNLDRQARTPSSRVQAAAAANRVVAAVTKLGSAGSHD